MSKIELNCFWEENLKLWNIWSKWMEVADNMKIESRAGDLQPDLNPPLDLRQTEKSLYLPIGSVAQTMVANNIRSIIKIISHP